MNIYIAIVGFAWVLLFTALASMMLIIKHCVDFDKVRSQSDLDVCMRSVIPPRSMLTYIGKKLYAIMKYVFSCLLLCTIILIAYKVCK
jgi:hypothetical protein